MQRAVEEDNADFVRAEIAAGNASPDMTLWHIKGMPTVAEFAIQCGASRVLQFLLASRISLAPGRVVPMYHALALSANPRGVLRAFADSPHPAKNMFLENIPPDVLRTIVIDQETFEHIRNKTGLLLISGRPPDQPPDEREGETKSGMSFVGLSSQLYDLPVVLPH